MCSSNHRKNVVRQKKRFIAGASCPECKAMDTMMLYREHDVEKVECVECGHKMAQPDNAVPVSYTHLTLPTKRIV